MSSIDRFQEFSGLVAQADKSMLRAKMEHVREYGLRSVHVSCILALGGSEGGLSATQLREVCGVDRALISRVAAELCEKGFTVENAPPGSRRYREKLILTQNGTLLYETLTETVNELVGRVSGGIPPEELACFYSVFRRINENLADLAGK